MTPNGGPAPESCAVFVQVLVDANAVVGGSIAGVYMVDNRVADGSRNEGSRSLETRISAGSNVCFEAVNVDATSTTSVGFEAFGDSDAWGPSGLPQPVSGSASRVWTGQVLNAGSSQPYSLNIQIGDTTPLQLPITSPTLSVAGPAVANQVEARANSSRPRTLLSRPSSSPTTANPPVQTAIAIALDTQYLVAHRSATPSAGVYMVDNRLSNGSQGEASLALWTRCNAGDIVSFQTLAINRLAGSLAGLAVITGFELTGGNVFGSVHGAPRKAVLPGAAPGSYWLGQALNAGTQDYQVKVRITSHGLSALSRMVRFGARITCT